MKTSPLQLDEAFIWEIELKSSQCEPAAPLDRAGMRLDARPAYHRFKDNPLKWRVDLDVNFGGTAEKPFPYEGHIACTGFFTVVDEAMPREKQYAAIAVNCPSILYSTARETIALLTARGEHGKLLLPSVSFIDQTISFPEEEAPLVPGSIEQVPGQDVSETEAPAE